MQIDFEHGSLFYQKSGNGKKVLLLFHGFGQDHRVFATYFVPTEQDYTCFSFDLFFHGQSSWRSAIRPIRADEWKSLMEKFLTLENIDRFSVVGFSIGGRVALATVESFPDRIEKLVMIAGEGLRQNFWYNWATHRWLGKPIFRRMVHRPNMFFQLAKGAGHLKLVPKSTVLFASRMMDSIENRQQVFATWILLSGFKMTKIKLAELAKVNSFKLMFIFGKHDMIMKEDEAERILKVIPYAQVVILDTGHHRLIKETLPFLIGQKEK